MPSISPADCQSDNNGSYATRADPKGECVSEEYDFNTYKSTLVLRTLTIASDFHHFYCTELMEQSIEQKLVGRKGRSGRLSALGSLAFRRPRKDLAEDRLSREIETT